MYPMNWFNACVARPAVLFACSACAPAVFAQATDGEAAPTAIGGIPGKGGAGSEFFSAAYAFEMLGALVLVFLCFFVVVLLIKRFNGSKLGGKNHIQLLSSIGVGPREKVILLQVGQTQLLVGSTPDNIRTLHTFAEPVVDTQLEQQSTSVFSSVLGSIGGKA
jgi:flagellar protein FliO/FliZ